MNYRNYRESTCVFATVFGFIVICLAYIASYSQEIWFGFKSCLKTIGF